jgi:hypothetical protein
MDFRDLGLTEGYYWFRSRLARDVDAPWFVVEIDESGHGTVTGEPFCLKARQVEAIEIGPRIEPPPAPRNPTDLLSA